MSLRNAGQFKRAGVIKVTDTAFTNILCVRVYLCYLLQNLSLPACLCFSMYCSCFSMYYFLYFSMYYFYVFLCIIFVFFYVLFLCFSMYYFCFSYVLFLCFYVLFVLCRSPYCLFVYVY